MKPTALVYAISDKRERARLKQTLAAAKCRVKWITPEQYTLPIGALLDANVQELGFGSAEELPEPMLVVCGLGQDDVFALLRKVRGCGVKIECTAMLTPYNMTWSSEELYAQLCRERNTIRQQKSAPQV